MKNIYLFIMFFLVSCVLFAATNKYSFEWQANNESDMSSYKIFTWEGADTTLADSISMKYFGTFSHDSLLALYPDSILKLLDIYNSAMDGEYLIAGIKAVDSSGNESGMSFSKALKKTDLQKPSKVSFIRVLK